MVSIHFSFNIGLNFIHNTLQSSIIAHIRKTYRKAAIDNENRDSTLIIPTNRKPLYVSTIRASRNILRSIIHRIDKRLLPVLHRLHSLLPRTHRSPIHPHGLIHRLRHAHHVPLLHHILHLPIHPRRNKPIPHHIHRRCRNRRLRRYTSQPLDFSTIRINSTLLRKIHRAVHRLHLRRRRSIARRFLHDRYGRFFLLLRIISRLNWYSTFWLRPRGRPRRRLATPFPLLRRGSRRRTAGGRLGRKIRRGSRRIR